MRSRLLILVVVAVLGLCGCSPASTLTKQGYITQADALCKSSQAKAKGLQRQLNELFAHEPTAGAPVRAWAGKVTKILDESVVAAAAELKRLRALTPPSGYQATVTRIWDALGIQANDLRSFRTRVRTLQFAAANKEEQKELTAQHGYQRIAQDFGFRFCGKAHG